mgnify:FL=1
MPDGAGRGFDAVQTEYRCWRYGALSDRQLDDWQALCDRDPSTRSALLGPEFAGLVAGLRGDVRVILASREGALTGVLALHKRPFGHARAVGAPFNDYCGPVLAPGECVSLPDMLAAAGVSSYHAPTSITPPDRLGEVSVEGEDTAFVISLDGRTPEEYIEHFRSQHAKRHKNFRRLLRQLERESDEALKLVWGAPVPEHLKALLAWKSDQFRRDGFVDVTSTPNSAAILEAAANLQPEGPGQLHGFMISLMLGDTLLAGHFGVRKGGDFHPWIAAYNPEFSDNAPGILLLYRAIEQIGEIGLDTYDLSGGHDHYKKYFAEPRRANWNLRAHAGGLMNGFGRVQRSAWRAVGGHDPAGPAARLRRRLDHIAACEPRLGARVGELVTAVRKRR